MSPSRGSITPYTQFSGSQLLRSLLHQPVSPSLHLGCPLTTVHKQFPPWKKESTFLDPLLLSPLAVHLPVMSVRLWPLKEASRLHLPDALPQTHHHSLSKVLSSLPPANANVLLRSPRRLNRWLMWLSPDLCIRDSTALLFSLSSCSFLIFLTILHSFLFKVPPPSLAFPSLFSSHPCPLPGKARLLLGFDHHLTTAPPTLWFWPGCRYRPPDPRTPIFAPQDPCQVLPPRHWASDHMASLCPPTSSRPPADQASLMF